MESQNSYSPGVVLATPHSEQAFGRTDQVQRDSLFKIQFYNGRTAHVLAADMCPVAFETYADVAEYLEEVS